MFCTSCGTRIARGQSHCTGCGARVEDVAVAAARVSDAARNTFDSWDESYRKSLIFGAGAMLASLLSVVLVGPAGIISIVTIPASIGLGIMALNSGRDLSNKAGYYLGMIGLVAGAMLLFTGVAGLAGRPMFGMAY